LVTVRRHLGDVWMTEESQMSVKKFAIPAAVAAAAVLLGSVSGAEAAQGGTPFEDESAIGPGTITNENSAAATGALSVSTVNRGATQGGLALPGLLGGTGGATTGGSTAGVQQTHNVEPGNYVVTVVWTGAQGAESHSGEASADVTLSAGATSSVVGAEGEGGVGANAPAPSSPSSISRTLPEVVVDQTGELNISAAIYTTTFARSASATAEASGSVDSVSIDFRLVDESTPETSRPEAPTTTVAPPATAPPATEAPAPETTTPEPTCVLGICL